jgi:hypothetical protein
MRQTQNTCWAFVSAMMVSWKRATRVEPPEALAEAGDKYVRRFEASEGIFVEELPEYLPLMKMVGEPPRRTLTPQYLVGLARTYGPLWLIANQHPNAPPPGPDELISAHAWMLYKWESHGGSSRDRRGLMYLANPASGAWNVLEFQHFLTLYEKVGRDLPEDVPLFTQVIRFEQTKVERDRVLERERDGGTA